VGSDAHLIKEIQAIRKKNSIFGHRLITNKLKDAPAVIDENQVHRKNLLDSRIKNPKLKSGKSQCQP